MTENIRRAETGGARGGHARFAALLLASLTLLLIIGGLASAWFFKQIDEQYSMLVAQTATDLNGVHDIAFHSGISYVHLLELPPESEPVKRAQLLKTIMTDRAANDQVFDDLRRTVADSRVRSGLDEVVARRQVFRTTSDVFISASGKSGAFEVEAGLLRRLSLTFEEYQSSCDRLGDLIQVNSLQTGAQVSAQIARLRMLFFAMAVLPIAGAFFLLILTLWLFLGMSAEVDLRDANSRGHFIPQPQLHPANDGAGTALAESRANAETRD